ncbi:MAG: Uma2 family endonuclease [Candidatus Competibacteraceae bacterium]|jgi:Uma2 family endonuclease|nr:Uma2 family endonuclease [Candidatus Competibacteraceae bacterium]
MATTLLEPHLTLASGDRFSRAEFEKRYAAMPSNVKCELIDGVVYMASPLRYESHGKPHGKIMGWLLVYAAATLGVELADNATVRFDLDSETQPDALLRLLPAVGGQSRISADDYVEGAPELIAEIASSSASYDLHDKQRVYRRNGVQEYLVWRVYDNALDWFELQEGRYIALQPDEVGVIESRRFPGLRLNVSALLNDRMSEVLAELQRGMDSVEHAVFVEELTKTQ